ncbi:MAG: branched-chain amino acid ABC transporter substrate-binding protein [Rhizobiaceae bacterium]|nr:branched-chain amino acid ABC transporter substrate-binding protein [Rhizobiaceae bacterium]
MGNAKVRFGFLFAFIVSSTGLAWAQQPAIGVVAPLSGPLAVLGTQVETGALQAVAKTRSTIVMLDDECSAEGGEKVAREAIQQNLRVLIGFLCAESLETALPVLKQAKIPVVSIGVRNRSLTDQRSKTGWNVFRLAPRSDSEAQAVARIIPPMWREKPFAIVDDGTLYGRELAESLRAASTEARLNPVFTDTYRPDLDNQIGLIGRLRRAGATHVFVGGSLRDIAIMARDAASLGSTMVFAGGEVLRNDESDIPLAKGTIMVGLPEWREITDKDVLAHLETQQIIPDGYVLPAYAAVQIAIEALATMPDDPTSALAMRVFKTALGDIEFDAKGDVSRSLYDAFVFDGQRFVPMGKQR